MGSPRQDDHPLLEARHIDALTQAVRALNITMTRTLEAMQKMLTATDRIVENTANLPALMDVLMGKKANGDLHDVAERTEP
jgi:hypothetical protein